MTISTLSDRVADGRGAVVYHHADLDPTGLAVTGWSARACAQHPWRMTATDHLGWLSVSAPGFAGAPPETPCDPALQVAVSHHAKAACEEEIRADLLRSMLERD